MKLQTQIPLTPQENQIDYDSKVVLMGSCFSENMGNKLSYYKFRILQNPFGIIFNPVSIEQLVKRALEDRLFTADDVFEQEGMFHCFEVHSLVSNSQLEAYLELLNRNLTDLKEYLTNASHIIFTFGTAWVYKLIATDSIVANCHKIPQDKFSKELLTSAHISATIKNIEKYIAMVNPEATIVFTVSPVRHIKDGMVENSVSKGRLLSAVYENVQTTSHLYYFPSYEIVMDELRDYRFYTSDMLHPSETAIQIIWEKFKTVWVSPRTKEIQKEIDSIQKGLAHRPFYPDGEKHRAFVKQLRQRIEKVKSNFPFMDFEM